MKLILNRFHLARDHTMGTLVIQGKGLVALTLEDAVRKIKVPRETAIPTGEYKLTLRHEGGMVKQYNQRFAKIQHDGMLWLEGVRGFEWVYMHVGNTIVDTDGCILVGEGANKYGTLSSSAQAYIDMYPTIYKAITAGNCSIIVQEN